MKIDYVDVWIKFIIDFKLKFRFVWNFSPSIEQKYYLE